jgi:hypothetical protein
MKHRIVFHSLMLLAMFLALTSTAVASSTWYVNGVSGSDGNACTSPTTACKTIGHAISLAHSGDSIMVAAATYTENLTINFNLKMIGSGAKATIIDGGGVNTVVTISNSNAHVTLSKVTIRNGLGVGHNSCGFSLCVEGGGIYNSGTLSVIDSTITGNVAFEQKYCFSSVRCHAFGGGIYNAGTLTISKSTIMDNVANASCLYICSAAGGGILNGGRVTINNSTISGNNAVAISKYLPASSFGGGISNSTSTTLTVNNSTISGNGALSDGGGIGGGISNDGNAALQNSIVASSTSGGNCGGTMTSNGYNLSSDGTCNFNGTGDLNNTDPKLGALGNYGGPTQTIPLLSGSPAIDAGNPNGCTDGQGHLLKTDQRGMPRPDKEDTGGCDMGAFERQSD